MAAIAAAAVFNAPKSPSPHEQTAAGGPTGGDDFNYEGAQMAADILIVDDEADIRELIAGFSQDEGYKHAAGRATAMRRSRPLRNGGRRSSSSTSGCRASRLDGLDLLNVIKKTHPDLPVVIISGHGNIETAVSAIKRGAYDYIEKPFKADRLILVIARALETFAAATRERRACRAGPAAEHGADRQFGRPCGSCASHQEGRAHQQPRADHAAPGCRQGASARVMHAWSQRSERALRDSERRHHGA